MSSNIGGLGEALSRVERRISLVEAEMRTIDVVGGSDILVSRINSKFVVSSGLGGGDGSIAMRYPWTIWLEKLESAEEGVQKFRLRTHGGMINGLLPDNFDDIKEVTSEDELYVYWRATLSGNEIVDLTIEVSSEKPDTQLKMEEEALPTEVIGLVGYFYKGGMEYQFIKNHIDLRPELLLSMNDKDHAYKMINLYSWRWSEV